MYGLQIVVIKCRNSKIRHFVWNSAEEAVAEAEATVDSLNSGLRGSPVDFFRMNNVTGMMGLVMLG